MTAQHPLWRASHGDSRAIQLCLCLIQTLPLAAQAAGIVTHDGAAITVSNAANRRQAVNSTLAISGVLNNSYSRFSFNAFGINKITPALIADSSTGTTQ
jgi:phosphate-selective porin